MARRKSSADPALDVGPSGTATEQAKETDVTHAPLDEAREYEQDLNDKPELYELTTKELLDTVDEDELDNYFISITSDAPLEYTSICGISFERRKGEWDKELRSWTFQKGRNIEISSRLANVIRYRLREMWVECSIGKDSLNRPIITKIRRRADIKKTPAKARKMLRTKATYDQLGSKKTEWFPLSRFLILEKRDAHQITTMDQFTAERDVWKRKNAELAAKLRKYEHNDSSN